MNFLGTTRLAFVLYLAVLATLSVSSLFADGAMAVLLVVVLIVLLLLIFVRLAKFTRAITRTVYAVDRFASGDFDYRISQRDVDSNGHIAVSLNLMADSIRSLLNSTEAQRNTLSIVLNVMADGVIVIDSQGKIELLNSAAETLFGLDGGDNVGAKFIEIIRDYDLNKIVSTAKQKHAQIYQEIELLDQRRFVSAVASPIKREEGDGVLLTVHDLTFAHQLQVTRREFVTNVSHELRNPLSSLKALTEALENGGIEEPDAGSNFLQRIHREIDRMNSMVTDLLHLSRLESEQEILNMESVKAVSFIDDVFESLKESADGKMISLIKGKVEESIFIHADISKFRQVLINLIDNGIKFTPEMGSITVSVSTQLKATEFRIQDNGIGIAPEHIPHLFERFYKVERSRSDYGTGLGLAIAKHIIDVHSGEIKVESEEGVGTTFIVTIPS